MILKTLWKLSNVEYIVFNYFEALHERSHKMIGNLTGDNFCEDALF